MRVLLDECLPRRLKSAIPGHEVVTVPEAGWAGRQNGELLELAAGTFSVFVTIDQHLAAQSHVGRSELSVVILTTKSNRFEDIRPLIPTLIKALESIGEGDLVRIGA